MPRISYEQKMGDVPDADVIIPGKRKFKIRPEDALQIKCISYIRRFCRINPHRVKWFVAQPERINAPAQRRDWLKKLGILGNAGHAEMIIIGDDDDVVFIEWKSAEGRFSKQQKEWNDWCGMRGIGYYSVRSLAEFVAILERF